MPDNQKALTANKPGANKLNQRQMSPNVKVRGKLQTTIQPASGDQTEDPLPTLIPTKIVNTAAKQQKAVKALHEGSKQKTTAKSTISKVTESGPLLK